LEFDSTAFKRYELFFTVTLFEFKNAPLENTTVRFEVFK